MDHSENEEIEQFDQLPDEEMDPEVHEEQPEE